jgi:molecular chaperone GrpE (heat shock protein)
MAILTSFYLYEWRRRLMEVPHLVLGDRHGKHLDGLTATVKQLSTRTTEQSEILGEVSDTAMKLQQALDQRDAEISRLRKGYDAQIFRRFLLRFVRVDQALRQSTENSDSPSQELSQIRRLLEDALEECGVEIFSPPIGADSRATDGIAESPKILPAKDPLDDHKVAEVIEPGYRLSTNGTVDVISPAKVSIFLTDR